MHWRQNDFSKERAASLSEKIALISINGTIDDKSVRKILPSLKAIKKDKYTKCVVVRVDSPGGSAIASETLYQELKALPQKVVFSFGNISASGGYYIAAGADRIFASRSTVRVPNLYLLLSACNCHTLFSPACNTFSSLGV